jgi:Ca-activated chloride channel family protein
MLAQDLKPTRLDRAKLEISDLISRLEGDEVGIVLFSGASFIQFPLTSDHATARTYLNHASPNAITRQGTVIAEAIETAMAGFSTERETQKVIVIMTDGENHEGDPVSAARQAAEQGAVIYTVGFGSPEGGAVPDYDERGNITGYRQDAQGQVLLSRLDEVALQQIADSGGGRYFRTADSRAMAGLAEEIDSFQDQSLQSEFNQRKVERFQLFLLAGALCLALAELTTDRLSIPRRGRRAEPVHGARDA